MPHYYAADLWSKVDIQHFNVLLPTTGLLNTMPHYYAADLLSKVDFNILMCPLANNWPPSMLCLTTMQLIFGPRWIFNILMCPLATTGLLNTMHLLLCSWSLVQVDIQHFLCVLLPTTGLLSTMHLTTSWSLVQVDIQHFNVSSCQQLASLNTMPHYYAADLWSKVYFNVSSCQQLASSILCTSLLCNWSLVQSGYSTF
jgi:hypothetical protein